MLPAARLTDMHVCPLVTGVVPHVGGPIVAPGCPTVLIGFLSAARVADMAVCVGDRRYYRSWGNDCAGRVYGDDWGLIPSPTN